jgi:hypothetical protein
LSGFDNPRHGHFFGLFPFHEWSISSKHGSVRKLHMRTVAVFFCLDTVQTIWQTCRFLLLPPWSICFVSQLVS